MRSDFMDIFLGANCHFAISTGTGWDAIPEVFRRPIVYVNFGPVGYLCSFRKQVLSIVKHHVDKKSAFELSLSEIFSRGVGFCQKSSEYKLKDVELIENTPEEIQAISMEMLYRIAGNWKTQKDDEDLQNLFWRIFPTNAVDTFKGIPLHGEIKARFGANFLRSNREWLN
jgi:putative glycosyltransferase (TIGR04372 family)